MFGTSGVRGLYGSEVTPELVRSIGNAVGGKGKKVVVCRDCRATSPVLSEAFSSGAMLAGADVIDAGIAPTPLLSYATHREGCDGAMITASHNPPEYNGVKLFEKGMEFSRKRELEVESAVPKGLKSAGWESAGQMAKKDYTKEYIEYVLSKVDVALIRQKKPRVLVDAGNAAAYSLGPAALEAAGCVVVRLNCDSSGKAVRNLEPKPSTLNETAKAVVKEKCELGVAFDGDGDRSIGIDSSGRVLPLDVQLAAFCRHLPRKSKSKDVVTTVEASLCVRKEVEALGGKLFITPVGSLNVANKVLEKKASFGGEPCGEYIFPDAVPCADGILVALHLVEIAVKAGGLKAACEGIGTYPMERIKYRCSTEQKPKIMQKLSERPQLEGHLSTIDGLRYDFADGWFLIRPSGTEPVIRLTCEATTQKRLAEIMQRAEYLIMQALDATG